MTATGQGYCPRCGTARVGDMPFCPRCGLNVAEFDGTKADLAAATDTTVVGTAPAVPPTTPVTPVSSPLDTVPDRGGLPRLGFSVPPFVLVIAIVIVGLIALGLLRLPQIGGGPAPGAQASVIPSTGVAAPIVGLSILTPTDGQTVATKNVVVIGTAPPGLSITQDVSFGLDNHTTVDGTGHWAMTVGLNPGDNNLKFRIGDDHSTEKTIRVIYTAPGS
jgi:hypothetical protein